jgi:hypothetical protein
MAQNLIDLDFTADTLAAIDAALARWRLASPVCWR